MPIFLSSFMLPGSGSVPFILEDTQLRGGFRIVSTIVDRDAILLGSRKEGILVYVIEDSTYYTLGSDLTTWAEFTVPPSTHNHDAAYSPLTHNHNALYAAIAHVHTASDVGANTIAEVDAKIAAVVGTAPLDLNTLAELADSINNDVAFHTTVTNALSGKSDTTHNHDSDYSDISHNHNGVYASSGHAHTISNVTGLQTALDGKSDNEHTHSAAELLDAIKTVDGAGSGLDADLLDGLSSDAFLRIDGGATVTLNKNLNVVGTISQNGSPLPTGSGGGSTGLFSRGLF